MTTTGIHDGLPFSDYLAIPAANASALKIVATCPAKLGIEREQSAAMRLGTLAHCALLEPAALDLRYAVTDLDRRGTKAWDAEALAAGGRELIKRDEWETALAMRDAVHAHAAASALLADAITERTLTWTDPETGVPCKARLDIYGVCPADLKTAADASPHGWGKAAIKDGYYLQAVHYLEGCRALGLNADGMPFVVVEKSFPHVVEVYELDQRLLDITARRRIDYLRAWREALAVRAHGLPLPGYTGGNGIHQLTAPAWALEE